MVVKMLENRVKELERITNDLEKEIVHLKLKQNVKDNLEKVVTNLKSNQNSTSAKCENPFPRESKIPNHLHSVHERHLTKLRGYRMRHKTDPNGACLDESVAVHVYEDENEATKVKKRINTHVAENWDSFYQYKIPLPYIETVGVGAHSKTIVKNTREEMLRFLRGEEDDDALMVYSNSQQLLAIANLFNIRINVFTYGGNQSRWSEICPDPEMAAKAEIRFGKWAPDMALYHSDNTHYDLLVKDDSRIALLGLLAVEHFQDNKNVPDIDDKWKTVNNKKKENI